MNMKCSCGWTQAVFRGLADRLPLLAVGLGLLAGSVPAATVTWTGAANSNWFDTNNWSGLALPVAGDSVLITNAGNNVLLTGSPPYLLSFAISNKTLIFSNWDACLSATNFTIGSGGTITVANAFTTSQMSNRVDIVCSNLTLEAGGMINVAGKGFAGGDAASTNGYGPGGGRGKTPESNGSGGGGGHGGRGGYSWLGYGVAGGVTNDGAVDPQLPGSGGGRGYNFATVAGGNGGGVVRIQAAGQVLVNGTITANGTNGVGAGWNGGGGAGGSIVIQCEMFGGGAAGLLTAAGGNMAGDGTPGGGGGGRIAVQCAGGTFGAVGTQFNVDRGATFSWYQKNWDPRASQKGTIYFSELALLKALVTDAGDVLQGINGFLELGSAANWATNSLAVSNCHVYLPTGFQFSVAGSLTIQSGGVLALRGGELDCADLVLTNGGALHVYAMATNETGTNYGALVRVNGTARIASNCWIYPYAYNSCPDWSYPPVYTNDGGAPLFQLGGLIIAAGGGIDADGKGYAGGLTNGFGPGGGLGKPAGSDGSGGGGGHGGQGGASWLTYGVLGGQTNDSPAWPELPGSGGGRGLSGGMIQLGGNGGGVVWIESDGALIVDGTISANGTTGLTSNANSWNGGGGGGGSIVISCGAFSGDVSGSCTASGGNRGGDGTPGGGGGGRMAIWTGVPRNIRERYLAEGSGRAVAWLTNWPTFFGTLAVSNGSSYYTSGTNAAQPGTCFFFKYVKGTMISVPGQ